MKISLYYADIKISQFHLFHLFCHSAIPHLIAIYRLDDIVRRLERII